MAKLLINRNNKPERNDQTDFEKSSNKIDKSDLLSIGDLAKYCKVSTKTLRHYDKKGILKPALIDPETGYRYYNKEQLFWLVMIKRLKFRNFSLEEAKEYLQTNDISKLKEMFDKKEKEIDEEIKKLQKIKKMIHLKKEFFEETLNFDNKSITEPEVVIKDIPERK